MVIRKILLDNPIVHSPWETHLESQEQLSLQLEGSALQLLMDCLGPQIGCNKSFTCDEPMT